MFPAGLPLLLVPFALYNILVFLMPSFSWNHEIWHVHMMSGGDWVLTLGDAIIAGSVIILLIEMLRAARRASRRTIVEHVLSMVLFVAMLVEFMSLKGIASSTFFLLLIISFVDVAAGFAVSIRSAPREVVLDNAGGGAGA
jgi:uncharacterized membrane protein YqhA